MTQSTPEAAAVLSEEFLCLKRRLKDAEPHDLNAVALSGGGIRSASFAMGVLQALNAAGELAKAHYLSTVSGGGYTGGSLSWFLRRAQIGGAPCPGFPFGLPGEGARAKTPSSATNILNHIRQRANYLEPGKGFGLPALLVVTLRTMALTSATYLGLLVLIFGLITGPDGMIVDDALLVLAGLCLAGIAVMAVGYSLITFFRFGSTNHRYHWRRATQIIGGKLLVYALAAAVLGLMPTVGTLLMTWAAQITDVVLTAIGVPDTLAQNLGDGLRRWMEDAPAWRPMIFGALLFLIAPVAAMKASKPGPKGWLVPVGAGSAIIGLVFLSYGLALHAQKGAPWIWLAAGSAVLLGLLRNTNLFSLGRMYRDRLMEAFMPPCDVTTQTAWRPAFAANHMTLSDMLDCGGKPHCGTCDKGPPGPYHLINTNVVLPDSADVRFRGRAGDSFLLSPLWCGSNATGWARTADAMKGGLFQDPLDLATAIATSGAAVNGHTGAAPTSATRSGAVSLLLALFGLQLGNWVRNPKKRYSPLPPNDLHPGLASLLDIGMTEDADFVQLSDGGHFENLALYELIRRRVKTIVISDGSADPTYNFEGLGIAIEKARVDFGVTIDFAPDLGAPLGDLLPKSEGKGPLPDKFDLAKRGYAVARIHYPGTAPLEGRLYYIKATLIDGLPTDVYAYKSQHPDFPHESTGNQFFFETQFEAYRELGYRIGKELIKDKGKLF